MSNPTPYDFVADRQTGTMHVKIANFWHHFAAHADALDAGFSDPNAPAVDVADIMQALGDVAPELMWEFGPSDRGHSLCITAEFRDEYRPLARAVLRAAPDLSRWRFSDARAPVPLNHAADVFAARFNQPLAIASLTCKTGSDNKLAVTVQGQGDESQLSGQVEALVMILLGEARARDWLGAVDVEKTSPKSVLSRFLGGKTAKSLDLAKVKSDLEHQITAIQGSLDQQPFAQRDPETQTGLLMQINDMSEQSERADMFTLYASSQPYTQAVLNPRYFASANHSIHGEHFGFLKIPRTKAHPFNDVDDRGDIELALHQDLAAAGAGGLVAAGHGQDFVYIDLALQDLNGGLSIIQNFCVEADWAENATFHFLDAGLTSAGFPVQSLMHKSH